MNDNGYNQDELEEIYEILLASEITVIRSYKMVHTRTEAQEKVLKNVCRKYNYNYRMEQECFMIKGK